jgi:alpha-ribazole phosphatase
MGTLHSMDIYLVRHGLTKWNVEKRYLGHTDEPLLFKERNKLNPLQNVLQNIKFDFYYSSDLKRCIETYHYLLPNNLVCLDSRLRELNFGDWEGLTYERLKNDLSYQEWLTDWVKKAPPNGETLQQLNDRIHSFFGELLTKQTPSFHKNVLIITHGGVIRSILQSFELTKTIWDVHVEHAKAYRLTLQDKRGKWVCSSWSVEPIQENEM